MAKLHDLGQELRLIKVLGDLQEGICPLQPGCLTAKSAGETWCKLDAWKNEISDCLVSILCRSGRSIFEHYVDDLWGHIALYTAGFPCTPFSCSNSGSAMLGDANSQQMWQCLENIKKMRPAATPLHFRCFLQLSHNLCSPRLKCFLPWSLAFLLETISCYRDLLAWKCAGICPRYRSGAETHIGKSARETYLESSMSWLDMFMPWFWNNKLVKQMSMWSMFIFWSWSQVWGCMAHPGSATWL